MRPAKDCIEGRIKIISSIIRHWKIFTNLPDVLLSVPGFHEKNYYCYVVPIFNISRSHNSIYWNNRMFYSVSKTFPLEWGKIWCFTNLALIITIDRNVGKYSGINAWCMILLFCLIKDYLKSSVGAFNVQLAIISYLKYIEMHYAYVFEKVHVKSHLKLINHVLSITRFNVIEHYN